jgi:hypothetical protein
MRLDRYTGKAPKFLVLRRVEEGENINLADCFRAADGTLYKFVPPFDYYVLKNRDLTATAGLIAIAHEAMREGMAEYAFDLARLTSEWSNLPNRKLPDNEYTPEPDATGQQPAKALPPSEDQSRVHWKRELTRFADEIRNAKDEDEAGQTLLGFEACCPPLDIAEPARNLTAKRKTVIAEVAARLAKPGGLPAVREGEPKE